MSTHPKLKQACKPSITNLPKAGGLHLHPHGVGDDLCLLALTPDAEGHNARTWEHAPGQREVKHGGIGPQVVGPGLPHDLSAAQHLSI